MRFGLERARRTRGWKIHGFSLHTRRDAGVPPFSANTYPGGEHAFNPASLISLTPQQLPNRYRRSASSPHLQWVRPFETPMAITRQLIPPCPIRGHTSPFSATSEGESYLRFARATGLLPSADLFTRVTIEDAALDSFQNVLFSIARFRELTGAYPTRITVVGHNFKRRRFEDLHRLAIRWPKIRFTYEGVPLGSEADEREAAAGEVRFSMASYSCLITQLSISWPTHFLRSLGTCMAVTHPSPPNVRDGTSTCEVMAIMSVPQNCASCWSGVQEMAHRFSLERCRGGKSNRRSEDRITASI